MAEETSSISNINANIASKVTGFFQSGSFINGLTWLFLGIIIIVGVAVVAWIYIDKKRFNKKTTDFEVVSGQFVPSVRDMAQTVKIGRGGFQVLYLKKLKTWRVAYGGKTGINAYYFFIDPTSRYAYNGVLSAKIQAIDENGGYIPIVTTDPAMRSHYTSLETQIDQLHGEKKSFMEKYGIWVLSIGYVVIMGVFAWLSFKEVGDFLGSGSDLAQRMTELAETMNRLAVNLDNTATGGSGLIPAP